MSQAIGGRPAAMMAAAVLAAAALGVSAQGASAASSTCWIPVTVESCTTSPVRANGDGHFVHIDIAPQVEYQVVDVDTRVVVDMGKSGWSGKRKTIPGMYGRYVLSARRTWLTPSVAWATLNNN